MAGLTLRDITESDLDTIFSMQLDDESNRMAAFTPPDPSDRDAFDDRWRRIFADTTITGKVLVVDEVVVGHIFCHSWYGQPEVGYWIGRDHWGNGFASAGLRQLLELLTERPLYAVAAADNIGSRRVLEKCGFEYLSSETQFAAARGEDVEEIHYILTD